MRAEGALGQLAVDVCIPLIAITRHFLFVSYVQLPTAVLILIKVN
jgi:hypothetical protein